MKNKSVEVYIIGNNSINLLIQFFPVIVQRFTLGQYYYERQTLTAAHIMKLIMLCIPRWKWYERNEPVPK